MGLKETISSTPLIDVHTHIDFRNPTAKDPSQILLYHYIATELRSLGLPVEEIKSKSKDPVRELLPYFKMIRNTSTYWCLRQILMNLYEFEEDPKPENWNRLKDAILEKAGDKEWERILIGEKLNVNKIFLTLSPLEKWEKSFNKELYRASLRLDPLISRLSKESVRILEELSGEEASTLEGLKECIIRRFKALRDVTSTVTVAFQSIESPRLISLSLGEEVYDKLLRERPLHEWDLKILRSITFIIILDVCRELKLPIQIMVGVVRDLPGASPPDYAVAFRQEGLLELCRFFNAYNDIDFHLISAYKFQSQELVTIAKNYPNVYLVGYWWYSFYPESIIHQLLERLQLIPMGKLCGFFSDAYVLEWIYGKAALIRKVTQEALEYMIQHGFYTEEIAEEIIRAIFFENPKSMYKL